MLLLLTSLLHICWLRLIFEALFSLLLCGQRAALRGLWLVCVVTVHDILAVSMIFLLIFQFNELWRASPNPP